MSSHRRKRKKREVSSLLDGNYWQVSAASSSDGEGQEEEEEEAEEGDDAIEKRLASGPTTQQGRKVVQATLTLAEKSEAMEVVREEAEGDETERTKDRSANVKQNAKAKEKSERGAEREAGEEGGEEQKDAAAANTSEAGGALHEQKEEDDGKALAEVDRGDNEDRRTTMEVAEETERRTELQPDEIKAETEGETAPQVGGGVAMATAATTEEAAEGTVIKLDDTSVREEEAEERQQQQKEEEESEEERSTKGTTTTMKKKEEGIWQRVKRRRKERPKADGASGLFELGPALPVSFSSVSIYSAHSPIPLPSIGTALQRRLKGSKAGGADDGDELLDGTVNTGRKAQFACWRRPNRSIPSRTHDLSSCRSLQ